MAFPLEEFKERWTEIGRGRRKAGPAL